MWSPIWSPTFALAFKGILRDSADVLYYSRILIDRQYGAREYPLYCAREARWFMQGLRLDRLEATCPTENPDRFRALVGTTGWVARGAQGISVDCRSEARAPLARGKYLSLCIEFKAAVALAPVSPGQQACIFHDAALAQRFLLL